MSAKNRFKSTIFDNRIGFLRQNHLKLNTHEAFLCLAQSILLTRAQPYTWVLSVNVFGKSHNKWLLRQSQHFRRPLIIFPHLTRAKHPQTTPKNCRLLHNVAWKLFSTHTVDLFKIPDVNQLQWNPLYGHPLYTDSFVCLDKKLIYFL